MRTQEVAAPNGGSPRRCRVAHAWLSDEIYARLCAEAEARREHPDQLAASIVQVIIGQRLVAALLDR